MERKKQTATVAVQAVQQRRDYRKELWIGVAVAVARAENARSKTVPAQWANEALAEFDRQFKETK
jgi:hypothetical protein